KDSKGSSQGSPAPGSNATKESGMTYGMKVLLAVVVFDILLFAFFAYFFTRDNVPATGLWFAAAFIVVLSVLMVPHLMPNKEEKSFQELSSTGKGVPTTGVVVALSREGSMETNNYRYIETALTVDMEVAGQTKRVKLKVRIEDFLLPTFAT